MAKNFSFGGSPYQSSNRRIAQMLLQQEKAAPPVQSNMQGLASLFRQGLAGYLQYQDSQDQQAAQSALMKGMSAKPWVNPDTGKTSTAPAGGLEGALTALGGVDNGYGRNLAQQLQIMKLGQDRQDQTDATKRAQELADQAMQDRQALALKAAPGWKQPVPGRDVPFSPAVQNQKKETAQLRGGNVPGFMKTPEGKLAPIPGGPAALKAEALATKAKLKQRGIAQAGGTVIQDLGRALNIINKDWSASGLPGYISQVLPPSVSPASLAQSYLESALSNIGLDKLQQMREASPTGGALGQVPIQQQKRLEQVLGSLKVGLPKQAATDNIRRAQNIYMDIVYGTPDQIRKQVDAGMISAEQAAPLMERKSLSFDQFGDPVKKEPSIDDLIRKYQ